MTEMVQPLRKLMDMKKYRGSKKLTWTDEAIESFHFCPVAVSNCQELYILQDTRVYAQPFNVKKIRLRIDVTLFVRFSSRFACFR